MTSTTTRSQQNVETVQRLYAAFGRGDIDGVIAELADDVDWAAEAASGTVPWYGAFLGKSSIPRFFAAIGSSIDISESEIVGYCANATDVVATVHWTYSVRATGKVASMHMPALVAAGRRTHRVLPGAGGHRAVGRRILLIHSQLCWLTRGSEVGTELLSGGRSDYKTSVDVDGWCREHLGSGVTVVRWVREGTGVVWGVELGDGRSVVVKAHRRGYMPEDHLTAVVAVQRRLADVHRWAPVPLAGPAPLGVDRVATAEALLGDGVPASDVGTMAGALRGLVAAAGEPPAGLFGLWSFPTLWPPPHQQHIDLSAPGGEWIDEIAAAARARMETVVDAPLVVGHLDWRCEHVLVEPGTSVVRAVHDWDSLTAGPEEWIAGGASVCFTVDFNARDGSPARWPSHSESAAFVAAFDPAGRLDAAQVRAAGDYHLAYIARCVHSVGGYPDVAALLHQRASLTR